MRVGTFGAENEPAAAFDCADGWASARLLLVLSKQSVADPRVQRFAAAIRAVAGADDDTAARMIHAYVQSRVEFVREDVETFSGAGWLLDEIGRRGMAQGDCDCMAQLVYATATAAKVPVVMVVLAGQDDNEPRHVLCKMNGQWAETTIAATFGEHPVAAAARLGVKARPDLAHANEVTLGALGGGGTMVAHSADVTDGDLDALVREFMAEGLEPRVAFDVMFGESGFRASRRNASGASYGGLNQMGKDELASFGLTLDQWLTMSAADQIPVVRRFWHQRREALAASKGAAMREIMYRDAPHLYAANFWPAGMQPVDATDYPLLTRSSAPGSYAANAMLDRNGDGEITIDDFAAWLDARTSAGKWGEPDRYDELVDRLDAAITRGGGGDSSMSGAIASGIVLGAAFVAAKILLG